MLSVSRNLPLIFFSFATLSISIFPRGLVALKCHVCSSEDSTNCEGSRECPIETEFCVKHGGELNGNTGVSKPCYPAIIRGAGVKEGCQSSKTTGNALGTNANSEGSVCLCKGDNYNGSSSLRFSWRLSIMAVCACILVTFYFWHSA